VRRWLWVLGGLIVATGAFTAYLGAWQRISVVEGEQGPFTLIYRDAAGSDMRQVGKITTDLDSLLARQGVDHRRPLDVFAPDGHAQIGFAVESLTDVQRAALLREAQVREIPSQRCMAAEIPWRNALSFVVGYLKVDPALARHRDAHGYKKVEALVLNNGASLLYFQPIVPR